MSSLTERIKNFLFGPEKEDEPPVEVIAEVPFEPEPQAIIHYQPIEDMSSPDKPKRKHKVKVIIKPRRKRRK